MLVTEFGDALIKNYRELERDFATLAERRLHPITATVARHSKTGAKVSVRAKLD
jgi:molybdenum-dependent DNA-binding transcriptional regulator ModE